MIWPYTELIDFKLTKDMGGWNFFRSGIFLLNFTLKFWLIYMDTVVLWSKSSTLDWKVEGSNPAAANYLCKIGVIFTEVYANVSPFLGDFRMSNQ